jgi:hypothetical protein
VIAWDRPPQSCSPAPPQVLEFVSLLFRSRRQHPAGTGSYLSVGRWPALCRAAGTRRTRTAHLGPDNDRVTSSALQQLAVVVAVTVVVMLLVIWRRR